MQNYEINENTLAIFPIEKDIVQVYEIDTSFLVYSTPTKIMEESCLYFGSSLEGRKKGTQAMIGVCQRSPIIVEESSNLIFFPLSSKVYKDNAWICFNKIVKYYKDKNGLVFQFTNHQKIVLDSSYEMADYQILRSTRLESALRGRKNAKKRFKI